MSKQMKWITRLTAFLLIFVAFNAFAQASNNAVSLARMKIICANDVATTKCQAVRAAILRNAMTKLRYLS